MDTSRFSGWAAAGGGVGGGDGWGGRLPVMAATAPPQMPGCDADCALPGLHRITPLPPCCNINKYQCVFHICAQCGQVTLGFSCNLAWALRHAMSSSHCFLPHMVPHHGRSSATLLTHELGCVLGRCLAVAAQAMGAASSLAALRTEEGLAQTV